MDKNQSAAPAADVEGLTDERITEISRAYRTASGLLLQDLSFARAIEREVLATKAAEAVQPSALSKLLRECAADEKADAISYLKHKMVLAADEIDRFTAQPARQTQIAPILWFKRLTGAECKPDGRGYDVLFAPADGYEPLWTAEQMDDYARSAIAAHLARQAQAEAVQPAEQQFGASAGLTPEYKAAQQAKNEATRNMLDKVYRNLASAPQADEQPSMAGAAKGGNISLQGPESFNAHPTRVGAMVKCERGNYLRRIDVERILAAPVAQEGEQSAQGVDGVRWDLFPGYLIDHCEGDTISEEGLQFALTGMLKDPQYLAACATHPTPSDSGSVDTPVLRERFKYMLWDEYTELVAHLDSLIAARVAGVRKDALDKAVDACREIVAKYVNLASEGKIDSIKRNRNNWKVDAASECADAVRALHSPATSSKEP